MFERGTLLFSITVTLLHFITSGKQAVMKSKIACFHTVSYYFWNPSITGREHLSYIYDNYEYKHVNVSLNCEIFGEAPGIVEVESVFLMLPATEEEYCIDSTSTNYSSCPIYSPCSCCTLPKSTCNKTLKLDYDSCKYKETCTLEIQSEWLSECPGRMYNCNYDYCHSRWVQVNYKCIQWGKENISFKL